MTIKEQYEKLFGKKLKESIYQDFIKDVILKAGKEVFDSKYHKLLVVKELASNIMSFQLYRRANNNNSERFMKSAAQMLKFKITAENSLERIAIQDDLRTDFINYLESLHGMKDTMYNLTKKLKKDSINTNSFEEKWKEIVKILGYATSILLKLRNTSHHTILIEASKFEMVGGLTGRVKYIMIDYSKTIERSNFNSDQIEFLKSIGEIPNLQINLNKLFDLHRVEYKQFLEEYWLAVDDYCTNGLGYSVRVVI